MGTTSAGLATLAVLASLALGLVGCAKARTPIHADSRLSSIRIDTVTVLPVIDKRRDRSVAVDLEARIQVPVLGILQRRGYPASVAGVLAEGRQVTIEEVSEMATDELFALGPSGSRFLLLVYLEDVQDAYAVIAHTFQLEISATLLDRQAAARLWRDKCVVGESSGGLLTGVVGAAIASGLTSTHYERCLAALFETLPRK